MKFKSKKDALYLCVYIFLLLLLVGAIVGLFFLYATFVTNFLIQLLVVIGVFLVGLLGFRMISSLASTSYILDENKLIIKVGKEVDQILYSRILILEETKKLFVTGAFEINKLAITYTDGNLRNTKYVSPKNKEKFIKELKLRCHSMKIIRR